MPKQDFDIGFVIDHENEKIHLRPLSMNIVLVGIPQIAQQDIAKPWDGHVIDNTGWCFPEGGPLCPIGAEMLRNLS